AAAVEQADEDRDDPVASPGQPEVVLSVAVEVADKRVVRVARHGAVAVHDVSVIPGALTVREVPGHHQRVARAVGGGDDAGGEDVDRAVAVEVTAGDAVQAAAP